MLSSKFSDRSTCTGDIFISSLVPGEFCGFVLLIAPVLPGGFFVYLTGCASSAVGILLVLNFNGCWPCTPYDRVTCAIKDLSCIINDRANCAVMELLYLCHLGFTLNH
jgi:hypothetical protein